MRRVLPIVVALALLVAVLFGASPASSGTLDFGPPGQPGISAFAPVTLNGEPQLTSVSIDPFSVIDATGSGAGWNVTLTVSNLVNGGSVIPSSSIAMDAPNVAPSGSESMTGVAGHAATGNLASGEKIVTAAVGQGVGTYLVSPSILTLKIPPSVTAGVYSASATIAVVSGP